VDVAVVVVHGEQQQQQQAGGGLSTLELCQAGLVVSSALSAQYGRSPTVYARSVGPGLQVSRIGAIVTSLRCATPTLAHTWVAGGK